MKISQRPYRTTSASFHEVQSCSIGATSHSSSGASSWYLVTAIFQLDCPNERGELCGRSKVKMIMSPEEANDLANRLQAYARLMLDKMAGDPNLAKGG